MTPPDIHEDLAPLGRPPTDSEVRHFLSRTGLGATQAEVAAVEKLGLAAYVDRMLDVNAFPGVAAVEAKGASLVSREEMVNFELEGAIWTYLFVHSPNPFQEVLALFWNDHFGATFDATEIGSRDFAVDYLRLIRTGATGDFKELVAQVSTSHLMLQFLNGFGGSKEAPNENFARELWELFTLGRDNGYTHDDILESARAFTGYIRRFEGEINSRVLVEYDPARHDSGPKKMFGQTLPGREGMDGTKEYRDVVELTFSARDPAPFIARKLWEYFVYLNPSEALVAKLGKLLHAHDWKVGPFLRAVFLSKAFFSPRAQVGIVKSPVEYVTAFLRVTGLDLDPYYLTETLRRMGQLPGYPPGVNGWPSGKLWLSSSALVQRAGLVGYALATMPRDGLDHLLPPLGQRSKEQIVSTLAGHLNLKAQSQERGLYEAMLDMDPEGGQAALPSFDGENLELVRQRSANLLYVLAQHPDYHLR